MKVKVTGILEIEDDEADPENELGLTEEAFLHYSEMFGALDDLTFRRMDDD